MKRQTTMVSRVEDYLRMRRQLGFDLGIAGRQLTGFARFVDRIGDQGVLTVDLAVRWARASQRTTPITWARRLEVVRPFATYLQRFDPATEIPPSGLFGPAHRRRAPHIYREDEIAALLSAAEKLPSLRGLRPLTYRTLFGLLAVTGMRISEALALSRQDVDLRRGVLTVRLTKFRKSRLVPLHSTTVQALQTYAASRDRHVGIAPAEAFFVSDRGHRLTLSTVEWTFQQLLQQLGWVARGGHVHPRIHDMRHTFICQWLMRWCRQGRSIDHEIHALSTYVGHAKVTDTYWYVTGTPELLSMAGQRFEDFAQGVRP